MAVTFVVAPYNSFGCLLSLILSPFGFTVSQISLLGFVGILVGSIAAALFGVFLDYSHAFKKSFIVLSASCLVISIIFTLVLQDGMQFSTLMAVALAYLCVSVSILPLAMTFSVEVTYPVNAALVNGILGLCCEVGATLLAIGGSYWMD